MQFLMWHKSPFFFLHKLTPLSTGNIAMYAIIIDKFAEKLLNFLAHKSGGRREARIFTRGTDIGLATKWI